MAKPTGPADRGSILDYDWVDFGISQAFSTIFLLLRQTARRQKFRGELVKLRTKLDTAIAAMGGTPEDE